MVGAEADGAPIETLSNVTVESTELLLLLAPNPI
jgi:hypothetical protein